MEHLYIRQLYYYYAFICFLVYISIFLKMNYLQRLKSFILMMISKFNIVFSLHNNAYKKTDLNLQIHNNCNPKMNSCTSNFGHIFNQLAQDVFIGSSQLRDAFDFLLVKIEDVHLVHSTRSEIQNLRCKC